MTEQLHASVELVNDKMRFVGAARDNPAIATDYPAPLGDGEGYTSLELLLMSLASCSGGTVASLLLKMRRNVSGLTVHATGIRREQHPTCFRTITLEFLLQSPDVSDAEMQKAIALAEVSYCPVWAMIRGNVDITTTYHLHTDGPMPEA
jgi:putative redox protein